MKNSVLRLLDSVYNTPHCITSSSLDNIVQYLENRPFGKLDSDFETDDKDDDDFDFITPTIGIVEIRGAITNRPIVGMCGETTGASYLRIIKSFTELAESGVKTILMEVDSPGGEAFNCFVTANTIRQICDDNEIKLYTFVNGLNCSAAYALSCVADEVISHPDSYTGNIGVVIALRNVNKAMQKAGIETTYITSSPGKVPFNESGEFRKEFLEDLQKDVDRLSIQFAEHVEKYTGISTEEILAFDAKSFNANEALEKGLINSIMTPDEFAAYIAAKEEQKQKEQYSYA